MKCLKIFWDEEYSFFLMDEQNQQVPCGEWDCFKDDFLAQYSILNELYENGKVAISEWAYFIDTIDVLNLDEISKLILGLPYTYSSTIYVQSVGTLNQASFKYYYGFYNFAPSGQRFDACRIGPELQIEESSYLLTSDQFLLCEKIDDFNVKNELEKSDRLNYEHFSEIKELCYKSDSILDTYLTNQNVIFPEKIKVDLLFENDHLQVIPVIDNAIDKKFLETFDRIPKVRHIYPISGENGSTSRVILKDDKVSELIKIKQIRKVPNGQQSKDIIDNPEQYFNPDLVDFSVFYSDRVKEIGVYKPTYYPFICAYKSEWIPGIEIKDKIEGDTRIFIRNEEQLTSLKKARELALSQLSVEVDWENIKIPINEVEKLIEVASQQLLKKKAPVSMDIHSEIEVLIIKENAELTEFMELEENSSQQEMSYLFSDVKNLSLDIKLKEHQIEGVAWMQSLVRKNLKGCLLADDMGLGKTLQILYFIEWFNEFKKNDNKPYLIVAPVGLLENWENEYGKFFIPAGLNITKLYGSVKLTKKFDRERNLFEASKLQVKQIILTNYETLRSYQATLGLVDYAVVVLDEAQKIKTPGTLITNTVKALKAEFKIAVTGTPVENSLLDIWSILDFSVPGLLGNAKSFANKFQKPLANATADIGELTSHLRSRIGIFIHRRLKNEVNLNLPSKYDNQNSRIMRIMPKEQLNRYLMALERVNSQEVSGVNGRNEKLRALWAIRDISDHPFLLDHQILSFESSLLVNTSAKLQTTIELLQKVQLNKEKVLIFADRRETQKMLQKVVFDYFEIFPSIINGDTPSEKGKEEMGKLSRQQTIDRFQNKQGFNVIILSPLAAGVGLNITEANHVIHYTRHWNPAKEDQATDRVYRMGQKKEVYVYYPMAIFPEGKIDDDGNKIKSFDEVLDDLLNNKRRLATLTLFPTDLADVTTEELFGNLFGQKTKSELIPLTIDDLDHLNPNIFEAALAAAFEGVGFEVQLTPYSNDKGADLVLLSNTGNFLIQVKQSKNIVDKEAVQEIIAAKLYYEQVYKVPFGLRVITNSSGYTEDSKIISKLNNVQLLSRQDIEALFRENQIYLNDLHKLESYRLAKV